MWTYDPFSGFEITVLELQRLRASDTHSGCVKQPGVDQDPHTIHPVPVPPFPQIFLATAVALPLVFSTFLGLFLSTTICSPCHMVPWSSLMSLDTRGHRTLMTSAQNALLHLSLHLDVPTKSFCRAVLTAIPGGKHSRLLLSLHLQAVFFTIFLHTWNSFCFISGFRHQGACFLKVHNYFHSVCSYCYRMLCFGALGSSGEGSSVDNLARVLIGGLVWTLLFLLCSVPTRLRVSHTGLWGPPMAPSS